MARWRTPVSSALQVGRPGTKASAKKKQNKKKQTKKQNKTKQKNDWNNTGPELHWRFTSSAATKTATSTLNSSQQVGRVPFSSVPIRRRRRRRRRRVSVFFFNFLFCFFLFFFHGKRYELASQKKNFLSLFNPCYWLVQSSTTQWNQIKPNKTQ